MYIILVSFWTNWNKYVLIFFKWSDWWKNLKKFIFSIVKIHGDLNTANLIEPLLKFDFYSTQCLFDYKKIRNWTYKFCSGNLRTPWTKQWWYLLIVSITQSNWRKIVHYEIRYRRLFPNPIFFRGDLDIIKRTSSPHDSIFFSKEYRSALRSQFFFKAASQFY